MEKVKEIWASGEAYEPYVGRWSRLVAREFLRWLNTGPNGRWLDVGCGTGALSQAILETASPKEIAGIDPSEGFIAYAAMKIPDPRARFKTGDACELPFESKTFDGVVSGLVLNFVSNVRKAAAEMTRVAKPGGTVAVYVWDYAGQMQLMRHFWDAAVELNPSARELDEGKRFPICNPDALSELFQKAGLKAVETKAIDIPTPFHDFGDFWQPFLGGQGPAPMYAMSLSEEKRAALRETIRARLPIQPDGSIHLIARAWAVRGSRE
ncbi:MAG: methyltransferase domain-containing protein [candidate division Zixibacteria bacterium]|nr:methyltransferase domain-containing protein [candidate division Zixibacteria bacterium]